MWLATVEDQPAASTAMYLRSLRVSDRDRPLPIGYWAHLFVLPEHRKLMLYPQLVFTMRKAMAELGIEAILTAMRRPEVTEGHLKLGFKVLCSWPVLVKPLKPFALLGKHKGIKLALAVAPVGDGLWRAGQSMLTRSGEAGVNIESFNDERVRGDARLLDEICGLLAASAGDRATMAWTADLMRARLGGGVDGEPYSVLLARRDGKITGAGICRLARRGNDIRTGVILELAANDNDRGVLRALARACERELAGRGAEAMLWLDGAGQQPSATLRGMGYRVAADETYRLIAFTRPDADVLLPTDAQAWRFTFLDHDAF